MNLQMTSDRPINVADDLDKPRWTLGRFVHAVASEWVLAWVIMLAGFEIQGLWLH